MRVGKILVLLSVFFLFYPIITYANAQDQWRVLDETSDHILQLVKQDKHEEAKQLLDYFQDKFIQISMHDNLYSIAELRIIAEAHENVEKSLNSSSINVEEKVIKATQLRLVIDAIRSEHQPLWTEMESSIMTTFYAMKETIAKDDIESYKLELTAFLNKYETIHPSLQVDITPAMVQKLDSHISFLDRYQNDSLKRSTRLQQMEQMELELKTIFENMAEDDADPSLIWVMILTGGAIIITLTYVGWRKYIGDKQKKQSVRDVEK